MKFTMQLNLIIEGIGSSRNINTLMPNLKIYKDKKFLRVADFLYGLKKLFQYINEEIEHHNKKSKIDISKLEIEIEKHSRYKNDKDEIIEVLSDFINDKLNRDLFKKTLIKTLITLFKKQNKFSNFYDFCENKMEEISIITKTADNRYFMPKVINISTNLDYDSVIHDLLFHLFLNPKDVQKFGLEDKYEYNSIESSRYSPSSVLNELVALQGFKDYKFLINDFIKFFKNDFKSFIEKSKSNQSIEKKFYEIFILKNKQLTEKLKNVLLNDENEDFNLDELRTIYILLKNSPYKKYFKLTLKYSIPRIIPTDEKNYYEFDDGNLIRINPEDYSPFYQWIERIIMSIRYRKNKLSKNKNEPITWKDFRTYFRDYPYLLKLVPESKYPDNKIIFDDISRVKEGYHMTDGGIKELDKINDIFIKAVNIGQVLTKKSRTGVFDIENKEDKIDFVIERFSNLLKNQFNDNSKYYALIDKELE